jgi:hypothetical protein
MEWIYSTSCSPAEFSGIMARLFDRTVGGVMSPIHNASTRVQYMKTCFTTLVDPCTVHEDLRLGC